MKVDLDKWYRCNLDKERYVQLKEKSDWAGFQHVFGVVILCCKRAHVVDIVSAG